MPPLPPGSPVSSCHHRVTNIHSCSRSPAWPNGASRVMRSPVPKPSSETEKNWTRASDMARAPSRLSVGDRVGARRSSQDHRNVLEELDTTIERAATDTLEVGALSKRSND